MNQIPRIEYLSEKKLIGKYLKMSLADNKTVELWRAFMPRRKEIQNNLTTDLLSMQVYDTPQYFRHFNPHALFEKWAVVEVADFDVVPEGMEIFTLPSGQYAVFTHKGASVDTSLFQYIFSEWLPNSEFILVNRPHFELLGAKYKGNSPDSEEEIWIPIEEKL
jgi:AraC family transcriptional regulator